MKTIIFRCIAVIAVLVIAAVIITKCEPDPKPIIPNHEIINRDSTLTDSIRSANDSLQSEVNFKSFQANAFRRKVYKLRVDKSNIQTELDSLKAKYKREHTLKSCDSVVIAQNKYIDSLNVENDLLDKEAESYSKALYDQTQISQNKDKVIESKNRVIDNYRTAIEESNCLNDWTAKHKFWKWLLGIKCK